MLLAHQGPSYFWMCPLPSSAPLLYGTFSLFTQRYVTAVCASASPREPMPWYRVRFKQPLLPFPRTYLPSPHPHGSSEDSSRVGSILCPPSNITNKLWSRAFLLLEDHRYRIHEHLWRTWRFPSSPKVSGASKKVQRSAREEFESLGECHSCLLALVIYSACVYGARAVGQALAWRRPSPSPEAVTHWWGPCSPILCSSLILFIKDF